VSSLLGTKQGVIGDSLQLGALVIDGTSVATLVQHDAGVALQTSDGLLTYGVFTPAGATVRRMVVQEELVVPDGSLQLVKVSGLTAALDGKQDLIDDSLTFSSGLFRLSSAGSSFSIQRLIGDAYSPLMNLQYNNGISRMSVFGELRPTSINGLSNLDILDTITATQVVAANLYTKAQTDALVAASIPAIADGSLTIAKTADLQRQLNDARDIRGSLQGQISGNALTLHYTKLDLADLAVVVADKANSDDVTNSLLTRATVSSLTSINTINANVSGELNAGFTKIFVDSNSQYSAEIGSSSSVMRFTDGRYIDSYGRTSGSGKGLVLN
jgi:hypothetical protein